MKSFLHSKALRCTHCSKRKARTGWEAADGEMALNHPQDWCHLMPAPQGLLCHSKASGLQCAVALSPTSLICYSDPCYTFRPWPVEVGEGRKRERVNFLIKNLCAAIHGGYARACMHTSPGSEYCLNAF